MHPLNLPKEGIKIRWNQQIYAISRQQYRLDNTRDYLSNTNYLKNHILRLMSLDDVTGIIKPHGVDYIAVITEDSIIQENDQDIRITMSALGVPIDAIYQI